jgi:poly(3-hydroxybutyrate) depolymerase
MLDRTVEAGASFGMPRLRFVPLLALAVSTAGAQQLTGTLSLGVALTTLKNTVRPTGELKARIDSIDAQLAAANQFGRTSEMRRLYAKAFAMLNKRDWTPEAEYASSLVLRTDRQVIDPARRWMVRVEQLYSSSIELPRALTARATVRQRAGTQPAGARPTTVKELGTLEGVPRDLRDAPFLIEADLHDVPDGAYTIAVELLDSTRTLGTATLNVVVRAGLDASIARLEAAAAKAAEPVRSDLLFPVDRLRNVNASRLALGTFNPVRDFAAAESLLAAVNARRDPWTARTGDLKRHYTLKAADEIIPYRVYVPTSYTPGKKMPVVVALHGLGGTEDAFFENYGRKVPELAEKHGYIVAAPLGYRVDGGYGFSLTGGNDPAAKRARELSEQDVLQVLENVRQQYTVDENRVYLMGHSMGGIGTWAIATKYPDKWTALGVFSGFSIPTNARLLKEIPQFVVHGDADPTVPVTGSRTMVRALQGVGAEVVYTEVPGGNHNNVVEPHLGAMFEFFDKHPLRGASRP